MLFSFIHSYFNRLLTVESRYETIKGILIRIRASNPSVTPEIHCIYSDGKSNTLIKIVFLSKDPRKRQIGAIVYRSESGEVMNFHYTGMPKEKGEREVVDLLLEILYLENRKASL